MSDRFQCDRAVNTVELGANIEIVGEIVGTGNVVKIGATRRTTRLHLSIHGNNNTITIGEESLLNDLRVEVGSKKWKAHKTALTIGDLFSTASRGRFLLPNSGNVVTIGDRCMFSNSITIRAGEYPHLLFDLSTGQYLDVSEGIFIGNHVWVGEAVFISKGGTIPDECVVGTRSIVTKRFDRENTVIAGNPARIVKEGVQWIMNETLLEAYPEMKAGFAASDVAKINQASSN